MSAPTRRTKLRLVPIPCAACGKPARFRCTFKDRRHATEVVLCFCFGCDRVARVIADAFGDKPVVGKASA